MAQLIQIGNSQGLRIPKPLIELGMLAGKELSIEVLEGGGLVIRPIRKTREGWTEQIQAALQQQGPEILDQEWLDAPLTDDAWSWE
jgi:antitoxin MazE